MDGNCRMSILAYVAKINASGSKYIRKQKSTDFFLSLQIHLLAPLYQGQGQHNKLRRETKIFLDSSCYGEITNEV